MEKFADAGEVLRCVARRDKLSKSSQLNSNSDGKNFSSSQVNTLLGFLSRFTEPESLGGCKLTCNPRGRKEEATKQMGMRSLPVILAFHFKRFKKHFGKLRKGEMVKVSTLVKLPIDRLDLRSFQTSKVLQ